MTLEGRYRLLRPIGNGATAEVWQATDELLHRQVAVRLLRADRLQLAERFLAAGRAAARLTHSNAAAVYDVGVTELPGAGPTPYVVMELVAGRTLAARIGDGVHAWREAARTAAEVGAALAHAHGQWVTHGSLTPRKVLLNELGAKVIGFRDGSGADPDGPADDVHALGALLAHCLRATPAGAVPAELDDLVEQCLRHDAGRRPCADELALALADLAGVRVELPAWLTAAAQTRYLTTVRSSAAVSAEPARPRAAGRRRSADRTGRRRWTIRALTAMVATGALSLVAVAALGQAPAGTLPWFNDFNNPIQTATAPPQQVLPCAVGGAVLGDTTCTATHPPSPQPVPTQTPSVGRSTTRPPASRSASRSTSRSPSASASPSPAPSSPSPSPSPSASTSPSPTATPSPSLSPTSAAP